MVPESYSLEGVRGTRRGVVAFRPSGTLIPHYECGVAESGRQAERVASTTDTVRSFASRLADAVQSPGPSRGFRATSERRLLPH